MKKFITAVVSALLVAALAVSFAACAKQQRMQIVDVMLTGEQYCYAVNNDKTDALMDKINGVVEKLVGTKPYNPELDPTTDAEGVLYDYNGDGTEETVTLKTLYDAQQSGDLGNIGEVETEAPSASERDQYLVVATNAEFSPWEYTDGEFFAGVDMHVAKIIAKELNRTLVILDMEFDVVIQTVNNGTADMGMAGLTYNATRAQQVTFSLPYYQTTQRIAVLESDYHLFENCKDQDDVRAVIEGLGDVTAGGADGQSGYAYIAGDTNFGEEFVGFDNVTAKGYSSVALAIRDLSYGKIKFVAADKDTLQEAVDAVNDTLSADGE
ncbi:MAG TPA: transporter substrate-binding domain-containing protein [Candidatus Borkfalkia stercoripullorum]|nr:transporter substrate-binding domain-containing protein [Candidatus Borkfalkia stercoripullorum]